MRRKAWIALAGLGLAAIFALVLYMVFGVTRPASRAANGFCAAVRAGNVEQASAFATDALAQRIAVEQRTDTNDDEGRTLVRLKTEVVDVGAGQLGAGFTRSELDVSSLRRVGFLDRASWLGGCAVGERSRDQLASQRRRRASACTCSRRSR